MIFRQPKIHVGHRIVAAGCIAFWLLASSFCGIEHLFDDDHHHAHAEAGASETAAHHDSAHSQEAEVAEHTHDESIYLLASEQASHDSQPHDHSDDACCSSLITTAQFATPFVIIKPILQPLDFPCPVRHARDLMHFAPKDELEGQAKPSEWLCTPQVCLGPAHRSLAPPFPA